MFLLVSVRHVGAQADELQHGVSIQSSINLGRTFPWITLMRSIPSTQILARVFVYLPTFISQILDFICWMVLILIYFEWRDTENQQYRKYIKNLYNLELTNDQINLLSHGLKFVPTPITNETALRKQLFTDFKDFASRMRLQFIYHGKGKNIKPLQTGNHQFSSLSPKKAI